MRVVPDNDGQILGPNPFAGDVNAVPSFKFRTCSRVPARTPAHNPLRNSPLTNKRCFAQIRLAAAKELVPSTRSRARIRPLTDLCWRLSLPGANPQPPAVVRIRWNAVRIRKYRIGLAAPGYSLQAGSAGRRADIIDNMLEIGRGRRMMSFTIADEGVVRCFLFQTQAAAPFLSPGSSGRSGGTRLQGNRARLPAMEPIRKLKSGHRRREPRHGQTVSCRKSAWRGRIRMHL